MNSFRKYFAEFLGTGTLVFIACGVAAITKGSIVPTALAFGLVIVAMAYSIGNVSGCHINPAVSLAMLISGRMGIRDFIGYVIAQFAGGIAASGLFWIIIPAEYHEAVGYGANHLFYSSPIRTIAVEVALTFVFVLAVLGVTAKKKYENIAGVVIGLSLTLVHLFGITFTGTSVNPYLVQTPCAVTLIFSASFPQKLSLSRTAFSISFQTGESREGFSSMNLKV